MTSKYTISDNDVSKAERDVQSKIWNGGRNYFVDPNGDRLNLSRLTAYAEYGDDVHDTDVHHELPLMMIDAPEFLTPLSSDEHTRLHAECSEPVEVDGFPLLRREA